MLAVDKDYRKRNIGTELVSKSLELMEKDGCDVVVLETEASNIGALRLYLKLGFTKTKLLKRYYMNHGDAFRLKYFFTKKN